MAGCERVTRWCRDWERVSRGMWACGSTTKQSSKEGECAPRVNCVLGVGGADGWVVISPVGMDSESRTRYWFVPRVTEVPSMVGKEGLRVK